MTNFAIRLPIKGVPTHFAMRGKTPGHAFRKTIRTLIRTGHLKRQPRTEGGGWEGVEIIPYSWLESTQVVESSGLGDLV